MHSCRRISCRLLLSGLVAVVCLSSGWQRLCWAQRSDSEKATIEDGVPARVDYLRQIKPLLQSRCYACHGAVKHKAGLRLDTGGFVRKGGESGAVIELGAVASSLLIERVTSQDASQRMPPDGEPLTIDQIQTLKTWISRGATSPDDEQPEKDPRTHWAFLPLTRPPVPTPADSSQSGNPIDAFLDQERMSRGLRDQPPAPRLLWLRRLYMDLIGVPATYAELQQFLSDDTPQAYELTVDRLLDDPRHGQRWARHWMDVWRYSDWWGLGEQLRNSQKHIWHWRDWLVESLNADVPYDELVRQMLAADEIYPNDIDKLRATGYLARNYFLFNRHQWMDETVEHVSKGFLGLTMNCAKCHDHKYDPITQADYYKMRAFFEPYHVRLDVLPGEPDLSQDGLPRVYDGLLETPTFRFERGQESSPDKSKIMAPGVPEFFMPDDFEIRPVSLPVESWQPERRPWVHEAHLADAREKVEAAESKAAKTREKLSAGQEAESEQELRLAELALSAAKAEFVSVQCRAAAMRAAWARADFAEAQAKVELETAEHDAARVAARAERLAASEKAKHFLAELEQNLRRSAADKKEAAEKKVAAAREALEKAIKQIDEPSEQYTKLSGSAWTPTRFFSSTTDDPNVAFPVTSSGRRTALAKWITDRRNPLTARVAVNQIWMRHMGIPLAPTLFDLGRKGISPTHPELLDWLACELVESGWSMKHIHRIIVTSHAYRMSSSVAGATQNLSIDPDNRYWWRRVPIRLESQVIRDSVLTLTGTLDSTIGGPAVFPSQQANSTRRSLYFFHSDNERNLFLTTFDEALVKECYQRDQSILPQQALAMTNSGLILDAAPKIAKRFMQSGDQASNEFERPEIVDDTEFIRRAFATLLGIAASEAEIAASLQAVVAWKAGNESLADGAKANLIWALLNHNDFVTLR